MLASKQTQTYISTQIISTHMQKHLPTVHKHRQTDTTAINLVISPKLRVAGFAPYLREPRDLNEISLTQKEAFLEHKYLTGSMPWLNPNHNCKTCGSPEAFTSTTNFKKCAMISSSRDEEYYILKDHLELLYPTNTKCTVLVNSPMSNEHVRKPPISAIQSHVA